MKRYHQPADPVLQGHEIRLLVNQSVAELEAKIAAIDALTHFDESTWNVIQDEGIIVFERTNGMTATAPVQIIGTYNKADCTWLWSWDNPSILDALSEHARLVRKYGKEHGISPLTTRKIACEEGDCWEFTSLACKLSETQGGFLCAVGDTLVAMTFGNIKMSVST